MIQLKNDDIYNTLIYIIYIYIDWICYGILDDITDSFAPLIKSIEFEVDSIDELVLILKESEQSDMLRRIGYCRKRVMSLLRLLVPKADVVKTLIKRGETKPPEATWPALSTEVSLFLGDVQGNVHFFYLYNLNDYNNNDESIKKNEGLYDFFLLKLL